MNYLSKIVLESGCLSYLCAGVSVFGSLVSVEVLEFGSLMRAGCLSKCLTVCLSVGLSRRREYF